MNNPNHAQKIHELEMTLEQSNREKKALETRLENCATTIRDLREKNQQLIHALFEINVASRKFLGY